MRLSLSDLFLAHAAGSYAAFGLAVCAVILWGGGAGAILPLLFMELLSPFVFPALILTALARSSSGELSPRGALVLGAVHLTVFVATCLIVRRRNIRRGWADAGRCAGCGYDLRATPEGGGTLLGRCPECGMERQGMAAGVTGR